jgi:lysophospholipase L1-like esterase
VPRMLLLALATALALLFLPAGVHARTPTKYYVSLGDSYSQGVQPIGPNQADVPTNQGFTDFLYPKARKLIPGLKLVKLGCGRATTDSLINGTRRCAEPGLPYASVSRATSQLTYATKFLRRHRKSVALVTLSIGGNNFDGCPANGGDLTAVATCVANGIAKMKQDLPTIASALRRAAGSKAIIIGSTYPDVALGAWILGPTGMQVAQLSVPLFRQQVNPALKSAYAARRIGFVDATSAFGGYTPLTQTTVLAPFGTIPVATANICNRAWYCVPRPDGPDLHLRASGYRKLASLYLAALKKDLKR